MKQTVIILYTFIINQVVTINLKYIECKIYFIQYPNSYDTDTDYFLRYLYILGYIIPKL